jgi:hypothetical protein
MDREEESICCPEIPACVSINQEAAQIEEIPVPECITDNPAFKYLCLNYWVLHSLQVAWSNYRQHYGIKAHIYEGPEHKKR